MVTGPDRHGLRGNVFSGGDSAAGGSADRRNTLEQVLLAAPAAGAYTVTVRSFNVPNGPQPFALVVAGNVVAGGTPPPPPVTVFFDDFETAKGWTVNPGATDTATLGQWERGVPQATNSGGVKQLATTVSGTNDLVTGRQAGTAAGDFDLDGGTTSIQSPAIALPATGTLTLSFSYYFAHGNNSSTADFFRVKVVGATTTTVLQVLGSTANVDAAWTRHGEHHRLRRADRAPPDRSRRRLDRQPGRSGGGRRQGDAAVGRPTSPSPPSTARR